MQKPIIAILALAASHLQAGNCIPETFLALAEHARPAEASPTLEDWTDRLNPDGGGAMVGESVDAWNETFPSRKLVSVYSIISPDSVQPDHPIRLEQAYLWIGMPTPEQTPEGVEPQAHAALALLRSSTVSLLHSSEDPLAPLLIESLNYEEFFSRTLELYSVDGPSQAAIAQ